MVGRNMAWVGGLLLLWGAPQNSARSELAFELSWQMPSYGQVRRQLFEWIESEGLDDHLAEQAYSLWPTVELRPTEGPELLDRVLKTFSLADPRALALVKACNADLGFPVPPDGSWLDDPSFSAVKRNNLRLYYARWLAQHAFYDEVLKALAELSPVDVVDPAGLLFYRAIAHQQLVQPEESRAAIVELLEQEDALPQRFRKVAKLLERDLVGLKDESLDHVARRMNDVRRRLDIGLAGKQVEVVEKGVLDSLDRIIKKLESQQQQRSGLGGGGQSARPMQDSRLPSMRAPMQVDPRDIGSSSGWGELPEKEREQAMQQIGRDFPAHYRDLIQQYFRELARESNTSSAR
ncbi:MAG: hypothetical protein MK171_07655 [Pirellulales bacterium]|nr:hypothetical protein [Pirellulales bacterium]